MHFAGPADADLNRAAPDRARRRAPPGGTDRHGGSAHPPACRWCRSARRCGSSRPGACVRPPARSDADTEWSPPTASGTTPAFSTLSKNASISACDCCRLNRLLNRTSPTSASLWSTIGATRRTVLERADAIDRPDRAWAVPGSRAVGHPEIERNPDQRDVEPTEVGGLRRLRPIRQVQECGGIRIGKRAAAGVHHAFEQGRVDDPFARRGIRRRAVFLDQRLKLFPISHRSVPTSERYQVMQQRLTCPAVSTQPCRCVPITVYAAGVRRRHEHRDAGVGCHGRSQVRLLTSISARTSACSSSAARSNAGNANSAASTETPTASEWRNTTWGS